MSKELVFKLDSEDLEKFEKWRVEMERLEKMPPSPYMRREDGLERYRFTFQLSGMGNKYIRIEHVPTGKKLCICDWYMC